MQQQQAPGNQPTPAQVFQEAKRLLRVGDIFEASRRAGKLRAHFPDDTPILALHGLVLARLGIHAQALSDLVRAAQQTEDALKNEDEEGNPARPRIVDQLVRLSVQICRSSMAVGEEAAAEEAIENALDWDPDRADAVGARAEMLAMMGKHDEAHKVLDQAFKDKLDTMHLVLARARVLLSQDDADEDALRKVAEELEKESNIAGVSGLDLGDLLRALGLVLDRLGQHDDAFHAFRRAANLRRGSFDPRTYTMMTTRIITDWTLDRIGKVIKPDFDGSTHTFVLGSPLSGAEQLAAMLDQLDGACSVGPLETLGSACVKFLGARQGVLRPVPFEPHKLRRNQLLDAAKGYTTHARAIAGDPISNCIDTHPHNITLAGAAALMLPGVNIVLCRRDPLASALACYCAEMPGNHPYAGDLLGAAGFVADCNRLMDHWAKVLGDETVGANIVEVQYDELVADPKGTAIRVAREIGVEADADEIERVPEFAQGPGTHPDDFRNYTRQVRDLLEPSEA